MANTPLQNGFGHIYGPGKSVNSDGMIPVWLEQNGSKIMGGIINLQSKYGTGKKVADLYPKAIRTGTPCYQKSVGEYVPIPTFRVLEDVSAAATTVVLASWWDTALLIEGLDLAVAGDPSKTVKTSSSNLQLQGDGTYKLTITANALGVLKAGDALTLKETADWKVAGLTKTNLVYDGMDLSTTKLNITLVDRGRILEGTAPALPEIWKDKLQTVKYEEE